MEKQTVDITPHWPSLLRWFEQAASETRGTAKGRKYFDRTKEIRDYLAAIEAEKGASDV